MKTTALRCSLGLLCLAGFAPTGCTLVHTTARLPAKTVETIVPGGKSTQPDPATLQADLQRFADDFSGRTGAAFDDYALRVNTREARTQALTWKISLTSSAVTIATGPNPLVNLLDFLALTTLTRGLVEERAPAAVPPGSLDGLLEASRSFETNAWKLASRVLTPAQQAEFNEAIRKWRAEHASAYDSFFNRPVEAASLVRSFSKSDRPGSGSVFSLVGLDPTAGLDPAVREVTRTRMFAERALYAAQRLPNLLRWQTELLANQLLLQADVTNLVASADRLSLAVESVNRTAVVLPDRFTAERKAILEAIEAQESKLRELSAEVGRTLASGEKMSASVNTTLTTFETLMKRLGVGEPAAAALEPKPPFNVLDYAHTAEQISAMAQQLDALISDAGATLDAPGWDKRMAQLGALSAQARSDAKSVLNHGFLLAAGLVLVVMGCALLYRWITRARGWVAEGAHSSQAAVPTSRTGL